MKKEKLRLDLGCGQNPKEGFKGVDKYAPKVDYKVDLFKFPWPFRNESVEEIYSNQFFEHIPKDIRFKFMDECYRILAPEGKMTIIAPYYTSMRATQDPTHEWPPISEASFLYFNKKWREDNKLDHYPVKCDFDYTYAHNVSAEWHARSIEAAGFAIRNYCNVASDIIVNLTKRKIP